MSVNYISRVSILKLLKADLIVNGVHIDVLAGVSQL
jgi:hypothetical protein